MRKTMKQLSPFRFRQLTFSDVLLNIIPVLWFLVAMILALLSGLLLFTNFQDILSTQIVSTGLDTQRAQLVAALLLTAGAALVGATVTHRKLGSIIGASIIFYTNYLLPFIQMEQLPVYDAGGHLKPLDVAALQHTSLVMIALSLLGGFIGSAIGVALYETILEQPIQLIRLLWKHFVLPYQPTRSIDSVTNLKTPKTQQNNLFRAIYNLLGLACLIVLGIFAAQSGDFFVLSPDSNLHLAPKTTTLAHAPATGQVLTVTIQSQVLGNQKRSFEIYLPPTYYSISTKHYPTLYLLHGSPGSISDWVKAGKAAESANTLIDLGQTPEMIIVMPDGNGRGKLVPSEWGDSGNHQQLLETYVSTELVNYIDQHYRTIPDASDRAIGGLSMGGFGAANIAIHHPDIFGSVIALGGYYTAFAEPNHVWGNNNSYRDYNSPLYQIALNKQAQTLNFFLGAATQDQPYYKYTIQFANELKLLHIPYVFTTEPGHHAWKVWSDQLYRALLWIKWGPHHTPPQVLPKATPGAMKG
jgi:S-formylglutathione hydrolase FrmB